MIDNYYIELFILTNMIFVIMLYKRYKHNRKFYKVSEIEPRLVKVLSKTYYQCTCCGILQEVPFATILPQGYNASINCVCSIKCMNQLIKL